MKRQIKFRIWDILNECFIYPDRGYQYHYLLSLSGEFHNLQNGSGGDEYVIQQFTGLQDKNGADIYEGDIVKYHFEESLAESKWQYQILQVLWCNFSHGWVLGDDKGQSLAHTGWRFYNLDRFGEVVGNIFENASTLKS